MSNESPQMPVPKSLKGTGEALLIEWHDGTSHRLTWRLLREKCPCATCRTERDELPKRTGLLPVLSPQEAQPLKVVSMRPVGNYAYAIAFNDGHNSGIYSLDFLRQLGETTNSADS